MPPFEVAPDKDKKSGIPKPPSNKWWGPLKHPLTDDEFVRAFCQHVFLTTSDHSLVTVRNRAHRFIRNFMAPELERELTEYREVYK